MHRVTTVQASQWVNCLEAGGNMQWVCVCVCVWILSFCFYSASDSMLACCPLKPHRSFHLVHTQTPTDKSLQGFACVCECVCMRVLLSHMIIPDAVALPTSGHETKRLLLISYEVSRTTQERAARVTVCWANPNRCTVKITIFTV